MSTDLYWEPYERKKNPLPDALKYVLRKRRGGAVREVVTEMDINYLSGLNDAGIEGADTLIEAIEKHGDISIYEE